MGQIGAFFSLVLCVLPGQDAYRSGKLAESRALYAPARQAYETCAQAHASLAPYARIRAAVCRSNSGDPQGGADELEGLIGEDQKGPWTAFAHHELGKIRQSLGEHIVAQRHFESAHHFNVDAWWLDDVLWDAAVNLLAIPRSRDEGLRFFRTMVESPWPDKRYGAAKILAAAEAPADRLLGALGLIQSAKPDEAQRALDTVDTAAKSDALRRYVSGRLLLAQGRAGPGRETLEGLARDHSGDALAVRALRDVIDSLLRVEDFAPALRVWTRLDRLNPGSAQSVSARASIAGRYVRARLWKKAIEHYAWIVEHARDDSAVGRAELGLGRAYLALGDAPAALAVYERQASRSSWSAETIEASFQSGELHLQAGSEKEAVERYIFAARHGVTRYYGYRAQERLAELGHAEARQERRLPASNDVALVRPVSLEAGHAVTVTPEFERLRFFGNEGYEEAEWEAIYLARGATARENPGGLYRALGAAGTAYTAMQLADANGFGENADGTQTAERLRIRYPLVYWETVKAAARKYTLDPYLVLSIARQESTYRPRLISPAGARGVMQMMPRTAKSLAASDTSLDEIHLDHPATSILLGSRYLRQMLDLYDGNLVYALAAYNAGQANCDRWQRSFEGGDLAAFVEAIPFSETRNYVKRVLAHYATYHSLYPNAP